MQFSPFPGAFIIPYPSYSLEKFLFILPTSAQIAFILDTIFVSVSVKSSLLLPLADLALCALCLATVHGMCQPLNKCFMFAVCGNEDLECPKDRRTFCPVCSSDTL